MPSPESPELTALRAEADALQAKLSDLHRQIRERQVAEAPYRVGEVIQANFTRGWSQESDWRDVLIRAVEPGYSITYKVSLPKKNGDWSGSVRAFYGAGALRPKESADV